MVKKITNSHTISTNSSQSCDIKQDQYPDRRLLELLICPVTRSPLKYDADNSELISWQAQLAYPIVEGIPLLVRDAARVLVEEDA
ncbi:MAG: hypothetical protein TECD_01213 [Hyphomicrobiaceae bacterium hypho_1]